MSRIFASTVVALALCITLAGCSNESAQTEKCSENLKLLWKMMYIYQHQYGGRKAMSRETGTDFWLNLSRNPNPLIEESNCDVYVCPHSDTKPNTRFTTYRGPIRDAEPPEPAAPERVPARYNLRSALVKEIASGETNVINFELTSDGEIIQPEEEE